MRALPPWQGLCRGYCVRVLKAHHAMKTLNVTDRDWLANAKRQAELNEAVAALAARIGVNCAGPKDVAELWRLIRLARELGF